MDRNCTGRSWATGFCPPPSSSQSSIATQPALPQKSKSRRKRHIPPGPAGVWFQAKQHLTAGTLHSNKNVSGINSNNDGDDALYDCSEKLISEGHCYDGHSEPLPATDVTINPAWMVMQLQLPRLLTPFFPPFATIAQRHTALRSILPDEYTLLPDLVSDHTPLSLTSPHNGSNERGSPKLMVLIHAVHSHASCDWTVELQDETGMSVLAWIAPSLVMKERDAPDKVRAGNVWCLHDLCLMPSMTSNLSNRRKPAASSPMIESKCLLVQESNILQYWVAPKEVNHPVYLDWMQKRHGKASFQGTFESNGTMESSPDYGGDDGIEIEVEQPISFVPRSIRVEVEDEDKEVLAADFGLQVLPSLHFPSQASMMPDNATPTLSFHSTSENEGNSPFVARSLRNSSHFTDNGFSTVTNKTRPNVDMHEPPLMKSLPQNAGTSQADDANTINTDSEPRFSPASSRVAPNEMIDVFARGNVVGQSQKALEHQDSFVQHLSSFSALAGINPDIPKDISQSSLPTGIEDRQQALSMESQHPSNTNRRFSKEFNQSAQPISNTERKRDVPKASQTQSNSDSSSKEKPVLSKQNKPLHNLFSSASSCMIAMFEDEEDNDDDHEFNPPKSMKSSDTNSRRSTNASLPPPSMFNNSVAIAGMMEMFDEDDECEDN